MRKSLKASSRRWLERQGRDAYVRASKRDGYCARSAYKLIEMNEKHGFLKHGATVVDLGAAPGGWTQVICERVGARGSVVAVDLKPLRAGIGTDVACRFQALEGDLLDEALVDKVVSSVGGAADVVLSDMAPAATGVRHLDVLRMGQLNQATVALAQRLLKPGGVLLFKSFHASLDKASWGAFERRLHVKPVASRAESQEFYALCLGWNKPL